MTEVELRKQIERKELELNALLEITQSINNNVPEDSLYKIFISHLTNRWHMP